MPYSFVCFLCRTALCALCAVKFHVLHSFVCCTALCVVQLCVLYSFVCFVCCTALCALCVVQICALYSFVFCTVLCALCAVMYVFPSLISSAQYSNTLTRCAYSLSIHFATQPNPPYQTAFIQLHHFLHSAI